MTSKARKTPNGLWLWRRLAVIIFDDRASRHRKTMMAQALISLLPSLVLAEATEINQVYSAAGLLKKNFLSTIVRFVRRTTVLL